MVPRRVRAAQRNAPVLVGRALPTTASQTGKTGVPPPFVVSKQKGPNHWRQDLMATANDPSSATAAFQFRIPTLLIAMAWVGLLSVGLGTPGPLWSGIASVVLLFAVLTSALVVIFRDGRTRAVAIGFVVFCGSWILISGMPPESSSILRSINRASGGLYVVMNPSVKGSPNFRQPFADPFDPYPAPPDFANVCNIALASLAGVAGATIAQALYATRRRDPKS